MWRIEGISIRVTRGLQGRQRQELELGLSYSSGPTNLGVTDMHIGLGIWRKVCRTNCRLLHREGLGCDWRRLILTAHQFLQEPLF
jgi:hypothetical protein